MKIQFQNKRTTKQDPVPNLKKGKNTKEKDSHLKGEYSKKKKKRWTREADLRLY